MSTLNNLELIMRAQSLLSSFDNLVDTITQLLEEDANLTDIKKALQYLTTKYTSKEIADCCKTFAAVAKPKMNNKDEFNNFLVEGERTELEAYAYIVAQGIRYESVNIVANMTHFLNLWSLADRIRGNEGVITSKTVNRKIALVLIAEGSKQSEEVKEAWRIFEEEVARAKPRKAKFHPDNVSHLGDDALTKAYEEAFKKYNTGKRQNKSA